MLFLSQDHPLQPARPRQASCDLVEEECKAQSVKVKHNTPSKKEYTLNSINERLKNAFGLAWTQTDYEITEVVFRQEEYEEQMSSYASCKRHINVAATTLMLLTLNKVLSEVNRDLYAILAGITAANFSQVRKFVVDYMRLDTAEILLFTAFEAPIDEIFY
jgi:hypothetical protein